MAEMKDQVTWKERAHSLLMNLYDTLYDVEQCVEKLEDALDNDNEKDYLDVKKEVDRIT